MKKEQKVYSNPKYFDEVTHAKIIPKKKLEKGRWYHGYGRGSSVAFWSGTEFHYLSFKFDRVEVKVCDHYCDNSPFACFAPSHPVDDLPSVSQYEKYKKGVE